MENPFESKPRLVRKPTQPKGDKEPVKTLKGSGSSSSILSSNSVTQDYSPFGGVTFKENPEASFQMVGTGMGHRDESNDPSKASNSYTNKARERRRVTNKGKMMFLC